MHTIYIYFLKPLGNKNKKKLKAILLKKEE